MGICYQPELPHRYSSAEQEAAFDNAVNVWESIITGYQDGVVASRSGGALQAIGEKINGITLNVTLEPIDGDFGILGGAAPRGLIVDTSGFTIASTGEMTFDTADVSRLISEGTFDDVILHEMGHTIGVGTLWTSNSVYSRDTGQYTGAMSLAAYQNEFDPTATFIPIELDGGAGTANGHWNEVADNFREENHFQFFPGLDGHPGDDDPAPIVRFGPFAGESLDDELLSGTLSGSLFISDTTLGSFQDIGYTTVAFRSVAVPEPTSLLLSFLGLGVVAIQRRRV